MNQLKATTNDDASEAIVVSFDAKWGEILQQKHLTRVFRKRAPRNVGPSYMYIYIGTPVRALIGRCEVFGLDWLPTKEAIALFSEGAISEDDLRRYASTYEKLAVYTVGPIQVCRSPLSFSFLQEQFTFSPPQSFFVLSRTGQQKIDEVAGFAERSQKDDL
jgi:predicted transcriptional regulator